MRVDTRTEAVENPITIEEREAKADQSCPPPVRPATAREWQTMGDPFTVMRELVGDDESEVEPLRAEWWM